MKWILHNVCGASRIGRVSGDWPKCSLGQVAEWLKAAPRKGCYTARVVSEARILFLYAKHYYSDGC